LEKLFRSPKVASFYRLVAGEGPVDFSYVLTVRFSFRTSGLTPEQADVYKSEIQDGKVLNSGVIFRSERKKIRFLPSQPHHREKKSAGSCV
jgi:hypothetical protein